MEPAHSVEIMARTLWGEARGLELPEIVAIGHVIKNRAARPRWPVDILGVCLQPKQFSCWNPKDPNRIKLERVTLEVDSFAQCYYVALGVLLGEWVDLSGGADHYHTMAPPPSVTPITWPPAWARDMVQTSRFDAHVFYDSGNR